ncbi:MAG: LPXTG cell wall anchor domain-containing protein [Acidimicrobiales bacterium]
MRTRIPLALAAVALSLLATAGTAHAQYEPGPTTTAVAQVIPEVTVVRGQTVDVGGARCQPGTPVVVTFDDGSVLARLEADAQGSFVATFTIPADASLGRHLVTSRCRADGAKGGTGAKVSFGTDGTGEVGADGYLRQYLRVNVVAEGAAASGALPRTGSSNTAPLVGIGAGALVLGAAFAYGSRRPRTT